MDTSAYVVTVDLSNVEYAGVVIGANAGWTDGYIVSVRPAFGGGLSINDLGSNSAIGTERSNVEDLEGWGATGTLTVTVSGGVISATYNDGTARGPVTFDVVTNDGSFPGQYVGMWVEFGVADSFLNFDAVDGVAGNQTPVVDTPIANQSSINGDAINLDVSGNFSDPDISDTLTFSDPTASLPANLSINSAGVISGNIDGAADVSSPYTVTIRATDDGTPAEFVEDTFTWNVSASAVPLSVTMTLRGLADNGSGGFDDSALANESTINYWIYAGHDKGALTTLLANGTGEVTDGAGQLVLNWNQIGSENTGDNVTVLLEKADASRASPPIHTVID